MQTSEFVLEKSLEDLFKSKITDPPVVKRLIEEILRGSSNGLELDTSDPKQSKRWFEDRFKFQVVWLDGDDYSRALVRALWLAPKFAAVDFGGGRQRDFAQLWTDTARGFLGEIALKKFVQERFGVRLESETRRGNVKDFLPSDIKIWDEKAKDWKASKQKVSIKTTKFNGVWLDVGSQFPHSDVFVLIKIGIARLHYLAFLKQISFLKDKLFTRAKDLGELDEEQAQQLWNETPNFSPIPAYIAGFVEKKGLNLPIDQIGIEVYGRNKRLLISSGVGLFSEKAVRALKEVKKLDPTGKLPIEAPLDKSLNSPVFLANSGGLKFGRKAWDDFVSRL